MSSAGTSNKSKDKIRNTQRREIVGTNIGTKNRYINIKNIFILRIGEKSIYFIYIIIKSKERNKCFYPSQLVS
jgi:hypothetical protein